MILDELTGFKIQIQEEWETIFTIQLMNLNLYLPSNDSFNLKELVLSIFPITDTLHTAKENM